MHALLRSVPVLLLLLCLGSAAEAKGFNEVTVVSGAKRHVFSVELAVTPEEQARGLMFRDHMDDAAGMLFLFPDRSQRSFWMKNTLIPLDMLFIDSDGRIMKVHRRAVPGSLDSIHSDYPVSAVLEINGGLAKRLGIRAGDRVEHPAFRRR
jgi:uncharacterized membrane protein (UPF0127 family)